MRLQLDGETTLATLQDDLDEAFDLSKKGLHHFKLFTSSRDNPVAFSDTSAFHKRATLTQCFSNCGYMGNDTYQDDVRTMMFNLFIEQMDRLHLIGRIG